MSAAKATAHEVLWRINADMGKNKSTVIFGWFVYDPHLGAPMSWLITAHNNINGDTLTYRPGTSACVRSPFPGANGLIIFRALRRSTLLPNTNEVREFIFQPAQTLPDGDDINIPLTKANECFSFIPDDGTPYDTICSSLETGYLSHYTSLDANPPSSIPALSKTALFILGLALSSTAVLYLRR